MRSIQQKNKTGFQQLGSFHLITVHRLVKTLLVTCLLLLSGLALAAPSLLVSGSPNRSAPSALSGSELTGNAYIFIGSPTNVQRVRFYLDNPPPATARQTENLGPYDFSGTAPDDTAYPFNTGSVSDGQHTVYAEITYIDTTTQLLSAAFTINNAIPALSFSPSSLSFTTSESDPASQNKTVTLQASENTASTIFLSDDANWLSVSPTSGSVPLDVTVTVNPAGLAPGNYTGTVEATGDGVSSASLSVSLTVVADQPSDFALMVSTNPDRSAATTLQGSTVAGQIYVFVPAQANMTRVQFYIDNPNKAGSPDQTENLAPYDMAGTQANDTAVPYDSTLLPDGDHTVTAVIATSDAGTHEITDFFSVTNQGPLLTFSQGSLSGSRHVDNPEPVVQTVDLTASDSSNASFSLASNAAWLSGSADSGTTPATVTVTANPAGLPAGVYTGALSATANGYSQGNLTFTLTITDGAQGLLTTPTSMNFEGQPDSPIASQTLNVSHSANETHDFTVSTNAPWLNASPTSGSTPQGITISADSSGLTTGNYSGVITISSPTNTAVEVPVTMVLSSNDKCAPIPCGDVRVSLPYQLTFTEGQGHYPDRNGWGTGFTWIDKPSNGTGYIPDNLEMNFFQGVLQLTTTAGIQYKSVNTQDNALAVGFAAPNQVTHISTEVLNIPPGSGNYEQAGLWFGNNEDNYVKLVVMSTPQGLRIHYLMELGGVTATEKVISAGSLSGLDITLSMSVNPYERNVDLAYKIEGGTTQQAGTVSPPDEFFSFDAAGIDPEIGTRSFTGILATHRNGSTPLTYLFDEFTLEAGGGPLAPDTAVEFVRKDYDFSFPTSMVWGPDNRLYVTELFGTIHALTFDANMNLINDQVIESLVNAVGPRLTLGITTSPDSTPTNVELWVAHSSPSVDNGEANSGMVTRLGGSNFATVEHVITGLPRAIANHSINSIHFGPDNLLYIAIGGNTGAGAPNQSGSEFGERAEQPLSAAILVADVFAPLFDGTCANPIDIYGPAPCDVVTYATGLRNSYDFVFHSNGRMYATDNGLGVTGTYPPKPEPVCTGFGNTASYKNGGHNPGPQPDLLLLIEQDKYYGHPNPYRDECVFKDGSYQNVAPLPNWEPPIYVIGDHTSSNAIIEYKGAEGCVGDFLNGQLLVTNYSIGDDIFRIQLNANGDGVIEGEPLITGFNDPLPLAGNPSGVLFVGQFGGSKLTSLQPVSLGCWQTLAPSPTNLLDASAAAIGNKMYVVGGKNASGHLSTLWIYDALSDSWSQGANLPGVGVENPAVVAHNGLLYVFGGSTGPFSGAVNNAAVYNPSTGNWQSLAGMPTARGGATAQSVNGQIIVAGGMNSSGSSLATVEAFNPSTGLWLNLPPMQTRRDNPGSAVLNGEFYVFGGRTRNADGTAPEPALATVEKYNASNGSWVSQTPMPTGRRAMSVGTANGKAQITGGEHNPSNVSGVFEQNEEYDPDTNSWRSLTSAPTPRHGAATATINDIVHSVGGGVQSGTSYSTIHEALRF
ncbi:Kelch repeat-containing protein [Marinobacter mobilis]|uniref:N-acetylneuraminic acid mutarotase n=1 Tax=Marinobacter mobilis TaxID=488533 RepID=A0A1H2UXS3_9GAMM|nr:kelch repeat-containing protein [Marinobacter mobilis]SDW60424.1 N-acetylneuraminic acid mutarotase [Marinobacter mobilis]